VCVCVCVCVCACARACVRACVPAITSENTQRSVNFGNIVRTFVSYAKHKIRSRKTILDRGIYSLLNDRLTFQLSRLGQDVPHWKGLALANTIKNTKPG
jgi:hypothetical protein